MTLKSMTIRQLVEKARLMAEMTRQRYQEAQEQLSNLQETAGQFADLADNIEALLNNSLDTELHELEGD